MQSAQTEIKRLPRKQGFIGDKRSNMFLINREIYEDVPTKHGAAVKQVYTLELIAVKNNE